MTSPRPPQSVLFDVADMSAHHQPPKTNLAPSLPPPRPLQFYKSPLIDALVKTHVDSPVNNPLPPSSVPSLITKRPVTISGGNNGEMERSDSPPSSNVSSTSPDLGQVYSPEMVLMYLIKAMWTCEMRYHLHLKTTQSYTLRNKLLNLATIFLSVLTAGSIWAILNVNPSGGVKWCIALVATLSTLLKSYGKYLSYEIQIEKYTKATREYRRLRSKIDIKIRTLKIKVSDFERLTKKFDELENETPLQFEEEEYDQEKYLEKLNKEKVIQIGTPPPQLVYNLTSTNLLANAKQKMGAAAGSSSRQSSPPPAASSAATAHINKKNNDEADKSDSSI